jgi:hypothetical protein
MPRKAATASRWPASAEATRQRGSSAFDPKAASDSWSANPVHHSFFRWRSNTVNQGRHYRHSHPIGGTHSTPNEPASTSRLVTLPDGLEAASFLSRHL